MSKKTLTSASVTASAKSEDKVEERADVKVADVKVEDKKVGGMSNKMYIGPTLPGFAIQNRVYTTPPVNSPILTDHPELINLFIDITDYPKANRMLKERSGNIYSAYETALTLRR